MPTEAIVGRPNSERTADSKGRFEFPFNGKTGNDRLNRDAITVF